MTTEEIAKADSKMLGRARRRGLTPTPRSLTTEYSVHEGLFTTLSAVASGTSQPASKRPSATSSEAREVWEGQLRHSESLRVLLYCTPYSFQLSGKFPNPLLVLLALHACGPSRNSRLRWPVQEPPGLGWRSETSTPPTLNGDVASLVCLDLQLALDKIVLSQRGRSVTRNAELV